MYTKSGISSIEAYFVKSSTTVIKPSACTGGTSGSSGVGSSGSGSSGVGCSGSSVPGSSPPISSAAFTVRTNFFAITTSPSVYVAVIVTSLSSAALVTLPSASITFLFAVDHVTLFSCQV